MIYGKIKNWKILTPQEEIRLLHFDEKGLKPYIQNVHQLAENNDRYIVKIKVNNPEKKYTNFQHTIGESIKIFIPRGIIDNNLLEVNTNISCNSESCTIQIAGVEDYFDRVYNGATLIHDTRFKY